MSATVLLLDPKHAFNVGNALRACAILGADVLAWTGDRVPAPEDWPAGARLPREERMALYRDVLMRRFSDEQARQMLSYGRTPVCVEKRDEAELLYDFEHPADAIYVFGPEDGSVPKGYRHGCHRFLRIPAADGMAEVPLNLAAAVNLVLYDRLAKQRRGAPVIDLEVVR